MVMAQRMAKVTPMMQQYLSVKQAHPDCIIFYRLGDFYEMFFEDAELTARELELTLTGRECGLDERAPMCGVPHHAVDTYVRRMLEKGYKIAICEQMTQPMPGKTLVEREVVRIITPGTVIENNMLEERKNNFLLAITLQKDVAGLAFADVSTGEFFVYELSGAKQKLADEIWRIQPGEILVSEEGRALLEGASLPVALGSTLASSLSYASAKAVLLEQFQAASLEVFGCADLRAGIIAAGGLMGYIQNTQKQALSHMTGMRRYENASVMLLDRNTRRNLELVQSLRGEGKRGTLLHLLDKTATAMGGRELRRWIDQPLQCLEAITARHEALDWLMRDEARLDTLRQALLGIYDMERLLSRVTYRQVTPRDCLALSASLQQVPTLAKIIGEAKGELLQSAHEHLDDLPDLWRFLERAISPDAGIAIKDGGYIREGFDERLDHLRDAAINGKSWLEELEAREREATGIKNLKIGFNRVFGFYIEVTKSNYDQVPYSYVRKQTLAGCERYITEELKKLESDILQAQDESLALESRLFDEIRKTLEGYIPPIQRLCGALKTLDALHALALVAAENGYVRPRMTEDGVLDIRDGRHPVVENSTQTPFVPNDVQLDTEKRRMMIVTGPNMAGKSTYMRQVALIVLMAHIGSFVPAREATISLTDRIFTRVGASDDLASGQSTFMVEMTETAYILRNATPRSLIILDEIGRGTSTFDGLSIAWAVIEHLCKKALGKTVFATHYHELSELEGHLEGVINCRVAVQEQGERVIFLHKVLAGSADKSFGIQVARLAGVPQPVVARAMQIMARLESMEMTQNTIGKGILGGKKQERQPSVYDFAAKEVLDELTALDVTVLTPMQALNLLYQLREKAVMLQ